MKMNDRKPLILISNDDGVQAKGVNALVDMLSPLGDILMMAPDRARSGSACGITPHDPVRYRVVEERPGVKVCACTGTPVDCVKLALEAEAGRQPALLASGINHGDNSSVNAHYSGTMGAVIEGCLKGVPSIAFSLCNHDLNANFDATEPYVRHISDMVLKNGLPALTCLNVNFPDTKDLKGIRICEQAKGQWVNEWENFAHRDDTHYYWLAGNFEDTDTENQQSDHWALANGYVAITPTTVDLTAYKFMEELKTWF